MAEHEYVSLKDVLNDQTIPKLNLGVESEEEADYDLVSKTKLSSSPPFSLVGSCLDIPDKENMTKKDVDDKEEEEKGLCAQFSSLKHSRSDDPLVYMKCDEDDVDAYDDLKTISLEIKNFSWEETALRSNILYESEQEEEK